ncbi:MAG: VCBS repeat-containing protein [Armatimonadota bacterium]
MRHSISVCILALAMSASGQSLLDAPWRAYDVADFPHFAPLAAAYGDVDGDGDLDAVVAREFWFSPGIAVLLNRGDGSFDAEVLYTLSTSMSLGDIALADFDRDGDLDAVTSIAGNAGTDSRIALWRNNGDGAFAPAQLFAAGPGPTGLVVADFNGDGHPDVVTADNGYVAGNNATISLMRHNGLSGAQAGFLAPQATTVGDNSMRVDAADIDGDGDQDLVVGRGAPAGGGDGVNVLSNDGTGRFTIIQSFASVPGAYTNSYAVALADVDGDGRPDLISGGATNGSPTYGVIAVRRNQGGSFGAPTLYNLAPWSFTPYDIKAADVDGDGWLDVLATTPSGRAVDGWNLLTNDATGGFGNPIFRHAAKWTYEVDAVDVDDDGDRDVVTVGHDSSVITVHENRGDGTFQLPPLYAIGTLARGLEAGDLDNDGDLDLVAVSGSGGHILRNHGDGTFNVENFATPFIARDMILADMNNDGFLDLVLRAYDFAVALNNGAGSFLPAVVTRVGSSQAGEVGAFDLDNDGDLDIVATDPGPASRVYLFRNLGDGVSFVYVRAIADSDGLPFGVAGGDVDNDGDIDLVFNNALGLTLYYGNGDFTFPVPEPTGTPGYPFVLHDLNGDGNLDLAFQHPQESFGTVFVGTMRGFGDGGFDRPTQTPGPNGLEGSYRISSDVDVFDMDGDTKPDFILTSNAPNDLSIFRGNGDGTLSPHERYGAGYSASHTAIGDFNRDGLMDAAVVISLPPSGLSNGVVLLFGLPTQRDPVEATLTDLNIQDGRVISGTIEQLRQSDNAYLVVEARVTGEVAQPHLINLRVGATTTERDGSEVHLRFENRISDLAAETELFLRDWNTGAFVRVDTFAVGMEESIHDTVVQNASRFIRPSDGRIELHVRQVVHFPMTLGGYHSFLDHIRIAVR